MLPYTALTASADRRWTFRLLDRFTAPDVSDAERADLVAALVAGSDRRAVPLLERVLTDCSKAGVIREAAGTILRDMEHFDVDWSESDLRSWWTGTDPLLRRHALLCMGAHQCPDVVRAVAADPSHAHRVTALGGMTFWFDTPSDLRLKIAALTDPDPAVRECAATILLWDEPVAAEVPLTLAANDAHGEVATEAAATLEYYPSVRVIRCLHELRDHPVEKVRTTARKSLKAIRADCLHHVCNDDPWVPHIRRWLAPVWDLLAYSPEELNPPPASYTPRATQQTPPPGADTVLRLLADPDTSPKVLEDLLWGSVWSGYPTAHRRRVRPMLLEHPDPLVRERGTVALQEWADADALLSLVGDPDFGVRKSAMYRLGRLPTDHGLAAVAWEHLHRPGVFGAHASETVDTFVAHAVPAEAISKLFALATDSTQTERLRVSAVRHLVGLSAVVEVAQLPLLLSEPPAVTWALHLTILDGCADLEQPVTGASAFGAVDNLHVQVAAARAVALGR